YTKGTGWHDPRIVPYEPLTLDPAAITFHYGQTVFEGLKAYRTKDNEVQLFRPEKNFISMNHSNDRLVIPHIDEDIAVEAMKKLYTYEVCKVSVSHPPLGLGFGGRSNEKTNRN